MVRTAYHIALRMNRTGIGEHSRVQEGKPVWNQLWKLSVPPKVRNFVWRASSDILPTRANLAHRRVPIDPKCAVCGSSDETVLHILWQCPLAWNVWALVKGKLQKCDSSARTFFNLAQTLKERLSHKEFELWAMVAWSIWNAQNIFYFEASQTLPHAILKSAEMFLDKYQRFTHSMPTNWAPECATLTFVTLAYFIVFFSFWLYWLLGSGKWEPPLVHTLYSFSLLIYSYLFLVKKKKKKHARQNLSSRQN